jgi:adenylylsulfate kinase
MFTLWFMGRPASGKSTLAARVEHELVERDRTVENLDGDEVRKNLHPDLGFTKEDRALNNRRTAFIAKLLNRNGIDTIVAMITPFRESQQRAREIVEREGEFVLVYVKTPLEECIRRDPKGMYERAQNGQIENFTGVSHPFQEPIDPEIIVETNGRSVEACTKQILADLDDLGVLGTPVDLNGFSLSSSEYQQILAELREQGHVE